MSETQKGSTSEKEGNLENGISLFFHTSVTSLGIRNVVERRGQCKMCFCSTKTSCFSLRGSFHLKDEFG